MRLRNIGLNPNLALVLFLLTVTAAVAQTTAPVVVQSSVISLNELLAPWMPTLVGAFMALILALLSALTLWIKQRFNLQNSETFANIEARARETLQSALENAAGRAILVLGNQIKDVKLDVRIPAVRQAVLNVNMSAADAVKTFNLSEERIAQMIIDKIGILTAGNPDVVPTVVPAAASTTPTAVASKAHPSAGSTG